MKKTIFLSLFAFALNLQSQNTPVGGRTCDTPILPQQFETWYNSLPQSSNNGPKLGGSNIQSVFNIPVIVHIIHNNENLNSPAATSGGNINAAQVINQINILNNDFKGLNADTALIPNVFKPSLGRFQINFCLAVVNPTGGILAEPGIDRINRTTKGWTAPPYTTAYVNATIKPNSIWDPNRYLNIWVCALSNGILGFATFPNPGTSGITGLGAPFGTTSTDGVVILNTAFGSNGTGQFGAYNKGRTATHEVGHWIGLRHIWGDGTCATDFCNDTPPAQSANYNCPSFPHKLGTCTGNSTGEMTMNYMDYTNDACMYMFTNDQKIRAQLIMSYSPLRAALITSTVCNLPTVGIDPGISSVVAPNYTQTINCSDFIQPVINLTNYGSVAISSLLVTYNVNGVNTQTLNWLGNLQPNTTASVAIPQINGLASGVHTFSAHISNPNSGADVNLTNNSNVQTFSIGVILNTSVNSPTTCSGAAVTLSASGGTSYNWTGVGSSATVNVNPQTTSSYSVTITNGACNVVRVATVTVIPGPNISVNSVSVCSGVQTTLNASGAASYTWNTGSNNNSIAVSASVTTQFSVSGSAVNGCVSTEIATLSILPSPTLSANDVTICPGISATLSASGANSYTWNTGGNSANTQVAPTTSTFYVVTGFVAGCSTSKNVSVTVGNSVSIFVHPPSPQICIGAQATLNASGALSYSWSTGSQSNSVSVSPTVTTTYSVIGSVASCFGAQLITVTVNSLPLLNLSPVNVSCFGGNNGQIIANPVGTGPFTLSYSTASVNLPVGVYTVSVSDGNGCTNNNTVSISQPSPLLSVYSTADARCSGACNGTAQITPSGGIGPYTATVYPVFATGLTFTNLCVGSYTYYVTDNNGCVQFSNFSINSGNAGVVISTTVNNLSCFSCSDATISASGQSGTSPYTYLWMPGGFNGPNYENISMGCYTVTVKDAENCSSEKEICVSSDVAIDENTRAVYPYIGPNPVSSQLSISNLPAGTKDIVIYDARGRLINQFTVDAASVNISCEEYAEGVYLLKIRTINGQTFLKFIKQ